jgi:hypothetical protein
MRERQQRGQLNKASRSTVHLRDTTPLAASPLDRCVAIAARPVRGNGCWAVFDAQAVPMPAGSGVRPVGEYFPPRSSVPDPQPPPLHEQLEARCRCRCRWASNSSSTRKPPPQCPSTRTRDGGGSRPQRSRLGLGGSGALSMTHSTAGSKRAVSGTTVVIALIAVYSKDRAASSAIAV